jgi:transcriptional repressor NrdR
MKCPSCDNDNDRVVDSRSARDGLAVRRRRECLNCGERFTTFEYIESRQLLVVKRDGRRVEYDRGKLISGIARACEKRPVSAAMMDGVGDAVEKELLAELSREIPSEKIGELVMKHLRALDEVAYVRFASVYRSFRDVDEFMSELRVLLDNRESGETDGD